MARSGVGAALLIAVPEMPSVVLAFRAGELPTRPVLARRRAARIAAALGAARIALLAMRSAASRRVAITVRPVSTRRVTAGAARSAGAGRSHSAAGSYWVISLPDRPRNGVFDKSQAMALLRRSGRCVAAQPEGCPSG